MDAGHLWDAGKRVRASLPAPKKKDTPNGVSFFFGAGNEARTRFPASHERPSAIRRNPASPLIKYALRAWVEVASSLLTKEKGHPKLDVLKQGSRRDPAQRSRRESEEKVRPAHEKSPKAFFIALGLFLSLERATRLELASRHPTNGLRPFAGTLPHLGLNTRFARWR